MVKLVRVPGFGLASGPGQVGYEGATGFRYFVTFADDYLRTIWLGLMKNRSKLFSYFHALCAEIHTQFYVFVQNLRSDNAKEYMSEQFQSFMLHNGIFHQTSCVDTP